MQSSRHPAHRIEQSPRALCAKRLQQLIELSARKLQPQGQCRSQLSYLVRALASGFGGVIASCLACFHPPFTAGAASQRADCHGMR